MPAFREQAVQMRALRYAAPMRSTVGQSISLDDRDSVARIGKRGRGQQSGNTCAEDYRVFRHIVHASLRVELNDTDDANAE
jgi:hypothetical protein